MTVSERLNVVGKGFSRNGFDLFSLDDESFVDYFIRQIAGE